MKVKDTAMSAKEIDYIRNSTVARDIAENALNEGYRVGIKEVVKWITAKSTIYRDNELDPECSHFTDQLIIDEDEWQIKLNEWGIE